MNQLNSHGIFHAASEFSGTNPICPDILLVFIHGFCSGPTTWKDFPKELLSQWGIRTAVFQYHYASYPWQRADIEEAAYTLRDLLSKQFSNYSHLVLLTHSTGALVAKKMLLDDWSNEKSLSLGVGHESLGWRVRTVINLAGAHLGGMWYSPGLWWIYKCTLGLSARPIGAIFPQLGYYTMGRQLMPIKKNPWLEDLTSRFENQLTARRSGTVPLHITFDLDADYDNIADRVPFDRGRGFKRKSISDQAWYQFNVGRALHFLSSILKLYGNNLHRFVAPQNCEWSEKGEYASLAWDMVLGTGQIVDLLNKDDQISLDGLLVDNAVKSDQNGAFNKLVKISETPRTSIVVLTGPSGTGKSVVLRKLARRLARNWLSDAESIDENASKPIVPLTINLKRVKLSREDFDKFLASGSPEFLWSAILRGWLKVAESIRQRCQQADAETETQRQPISEDWVRSLIAITPSVIIFDSMNEFCNNYPELKDEHLSNLVSYLAESAKNQAVKRCVVCAVTPGTEYLLAGGQVQPHFVKLSRLSEKKVRSMLKEGRKDDSSQSQLANQLDNLGVVAKQAIALPSILIRLLRVENFDVRIVDSTADLLELALKQLLADRSTALVADSMGEEPNWKNLTTDQRIDLLTAISSAYAQQVNGPYKPMSRDQIIVNLKKVLMEWELTKSKSGDVAIKNRIVQAYQILIDDDSGVLNACLRSTIFQGYAGYVFDHTQWVDFCLGRYLCLCLKAGNLLPLESRAYHPSIYTIAADYLVGIQDSDSVLSFSAEQIKSLLQPVFDSDPQSGQFIIGNFAAIINRNTVQLDPAAIKLICEHLPKIPHLAQHVMLAALCHRVCANLKDDHSLTDIRNAIYPVLLTNFAGRKRHSVSPATRSLAYCYLKYIRHSEEPKRSIPKWDSPAVATHLRILERMAFPKTSTQQDAVRHRSLLDGYLQSFEFLRSDPLRTITAIHYLLFAIVGKQLGYADRGDDQRLAAILDLQRDSGKTFDLLIREFSVVPEVNRLFKELRRIYQFH